LIMWTKLPYSGPSRNRAENAVAGGELVGLLCPWWHECLAESLDVRLPWGAVADSERTLVYRSSFILWWNSLVLKYLHGKTDGDNWSERWLCSIMLVRLTF